MTIVGTPDFQDQAQWSGVAWDLDWSPAWNGPGNVFSSIVPCAQWLGEQFVVANTGARDVQITVTWFFDAAGTLPVASKVMTLSVAMLSARFFLVHRGPYFQVELSANNTNAAVHLQAVGSNRPQSPWTTGAVAPILEAANPASLGAGTNATVVSTQLFEGPAMWYVQTGANLFTFALYAQDYTGARHLIAQRNNNDTGGLEAITPIIVPPHNLVCQMFNQAAGTFNFWSTITADFSR